MQLAEKACSEKEDRQIDGRKACSKKKTGRQMAEKPAVKRRQEDKSL